MKKTLVTTLFTIFTLTIANANAEKTKVNSNSVNPNAQDIDTEHPYLITGLISEEELMNEQMIYLESHPEDQEELIFIKKYAHAVPSYIKFFKYTPNPNFKAPPNQSKIFFATTYPSSRTLRLISPALDQGAFGTCVTFATLGAISQQLFWYPSNPSPSCTLQMLKTNGQDAWNGYWIDELMLSLQVDGWISETTGQTGYCNKTYITYYPYGNTDQENAYLYNSLSNYSQNSTKLTDYHMSFFYSNDSANALQYIKSELNDAQYSNVNGAPGFYPTFSFNVANDPYWVGGQVPVWINLGLPRSNAGHEVFAYGYDDNVVIDDQKGVLYLRNSWGDTGSGGDYYMTYDYFLNYVNSDYIVSFPYLNQVRINKD